MLWKMAAVGSVRSLQGVSLGMGYAQLKGEREESKKFKQNKKN